MSESDIAVLGTAWGGGQGIAATAKYNPHLWSAEELRAIFVVRQRELASILAAVRAVPAGGVAQHMLITGQRGMGKSTLLQRVALAVAEDAQVNHSWLALRFPEEQYTVSTPGELWSNVIGALADTLERQGVPIETIDFELVKLGQMSQVQREEAALAWLEQWCQQHQKRLLLLMDSTDLLFSNLASAAANKRGSAPDGGASALWRVRKVLLHSPHFFWLGGSYQPLEAKGLYSDAFLDFFQLIELRPLTLPEMQTAILALARTFGAGRGLLGEAAEQEVKRMLDARPERLRAMRQLTGGNPRTTITLYELFAAGGQESVRSDLERLLDAMTPLYKAKLEILADQMRKVLAHVMESWAPITAKGLADVSGLAVGVVSTQLMRLEQEGLVEKVSLSGKKRQGYQVAERFFNIWYLMRNAPRSARARVGWLVEFMRLWYSSGELQDIAKSRWLAHRDGAYCDFSELEYSRAVARAMPKSAHERKHLDWAVFKHARKSAALTDLFDLQGDDSDYSTPDDYLARLDKVRTGLMAVPLAESEKSAWVCQVMRSLHFTLAIKEELAQECGYMSREEIVAARENLQADRNELIEWYGEEGIKQLEQAIENGDFFPDCPDLQLALTQIETCFSGLPSAFAASIDLLTDYHTDPSAELTCKKAIEFFPNNARLWHALGWIASCDNKQSAKAEVAYRKAIELDANWVQPFLDLGNLLQYNLSRYQEAELVYMNAIELDENWAELWGNLGTLLQYKLNRYEEAEVAYRNAIELDADWAELWAYLGDLLQYKSNRYEEAEMAYRKAIEIDANLAAPWEGLAVLLQYELRRYEEAEVAYRKAIDIDVNSAMLWGELGGLLQYKLNCYEKAELAYRKSIDLSINIDGNLGFFWNSLGELLQNKLQRFDEAEDAYRNGIKCGGANPVLHANLGRLVARLKRDNEATEQYRLVLETATNEEQNIRLQAHCWLGNNDLALQALDLLAEPASRAEGDAFALLREQCYEIHAIGLGNTLRELMERSIYAGFLQPFALALRAANGEGDALLDAPAEIRSLAEEILLQINS